MEATLQSMERHLAGVGGDGDGALEAEGGSGEPSVEHINFFYAGSGSLCSGVRSALGKPGTLVCSGDIRSIDRQPRRGWPGRSDGRSDRRQRRIAAAVPQQVRLRQQQHLPQLDRKGGRSIRKSAFGSSCVRRLSLWAISSA
jgi:hypothetical protein